MSLGRIWLALACLAVLGGAALRSLPLTESLPWFDGGLFAAIIDQLRSGSLMPETFVWSGQHVPFAYPPLAFQAAAVIGQLTGTSTLDLLRILPVIGSIASMAALFLAVDRLFDRRMALTVTATYALLPEAFFQLIAGGGLTRSWGLTAALLCLAAVGQARRSLQWRWSVTAGIVLGVTALIHPMTALLGGWSIVLLLGVGRPWRRRVGLALVAIAVAFVVVLPWLALLFERGQLLSLLGAGQRNSPLEQLIAFVNLLLATSSPILRLGALGLALALFERRWSIGGLAVATIIGPGWFFVTIPLAVGAGYLVLRLADVVRQRAPLVGRMLPALAAAMVLSTVLGSGQSLLREAARISDVTPYQAAAKAPNDVEFLVAPNTVWGNDLTSEWFPYFAEHRSLFTVQGSEWLGREEFLELTEQHAAARSCAAQADIDCLRRLAATAGAPDAWLFVPKTKQLEQLLDALSSDSRYTLHYNGSVEIFAPAD